MEANKKSNNWSKNNRKTLKKVHYIITGLNYHISPALMYLSNFFFLPRNYFFTTKFFFTTKKHTTLTIPVLSPTTVLGKPNPA